MSIPAPVKPWRRIVRPIFTVLTLGLAVHLLLPQLAGLRATGEAVGHRRGGGEGLANLVRRSVTVLARGPLRGRLDPDDIAEGARRGVASIRALAQDRHALRISVGWAAANWLLVPVGLLVLPLVSHDHRADVPRPGP